MAKMIFVNLPVADVEKATAFYQAPGFTSSVLLAISSDSRADVDAITGAALAAGGRECRAPQDHGFMYGRAFDDLDGHSWKPNYMDMVAAARMFCAPADAA